MAERTTAKTPRDFLRILFRRRQTFLLTASTFAVGVLISAHFLPLKYASQAKFRVEMDTDVTRGNSLERTRESIRNTMKQELAGRAAVGKMADDLGLLRGLPHDDEGNLTRRGIMSKQRIIASLSQSISVGWDVKFKDTVAQVSVSVVHSDPVMAERIPNTLVRNYINKTSEKIVQNLKANRDFLDKQASDAQARLTETTNQKIQFETKHAGMMPEDPGALQTQIEHLTEQIEQKSSEEQKTKQKLAQLMKIREQAEASTQPTSQPVTETAEADERINPEWKELDEQVQQAKESLDAALLQLKGRHPTIKRMRDQIAQLERRLEETPKHLESLPITPGGSERPAWDRRSNSIAAVDAAIAETQVDLEAAGRELKRLQSRLDRTMEMLARFAPIRQDYLALLEEHKRQKDELGRWKSRLTEMQMALAAEVAKRRTTLEAVQAAQEPEKPSSPPLKMILGFAFVGAIGVGGGLVFLLNILDRSVGMTEEAVKYFDVPVHGIISEIISGKQRLVRRLKKWVLRPAVATVILVALSASLLSVVLWLEKPARHRELRATPVRFVMNFVNDVVPWLE
jgi:protein tyrosine kinase modulator